ncbi:hypothetical protein [Sphingobacterium psychroaquaticum]|nr:hypothetical protein [Sphingobacterium psychroaquaticum]
MMKRLTAWCRYSLSLFLIVVVTISCKNEVISFDDHNESYTVAFEFQEFDASVSPLQNIGKYTALSKLSSITNVPPQVVQDEYLYYWSFNTGSSIPDISIDKNAKFLYNDGEVPDDFSAQGWASNGFAGGYAMVLRGLQDLVVKVPLDRVQSLKSIGFDISSSATGPKDFEFLYTQDGETYHSISADNQFANVGSSSSSYPKNSFIFYVDTIALDYDRPLYVQLLMKAGDRGSAGNYNASMGVTRIDNFNLTGLSKTMTHSSIRRLHYAIFNRETNRLVEENNVDFSAEGWPGLSLQLPPGEYVSIFLSNESAADLYISDITDAQTYSVRNLFSNSKAKIFGVTHTFSVRQDIDVPLLLHRYYSMVKFEFTDNRDLTNVGRITIKPLHTPFVYVPFGDRSKDIGVDDEIVSFAVDFEAESKEFYFHQFMGDQGEPQEVVYLVTVRDKEERQLRDFTVNSRMRNNMQLVFRGELLSGIDQEAEFIVRLNEDWDGEIIEPF